MNRIAPDLSDQITAHWDPKKVPGVVVGVLFQGEPHYFCLGETSAAQPLPVTPDTLFQIGSISKTFTAAAILHLVEAGKIELAAPVQNYLPVFRVSDLQASKLVQVQDLLTHHCGWEGDFFIDTGKGPYALAKYVSEMSALAQFVSPGTLFSYNNAAFNVAGRLIEVVSGLLFEEAIESFVFAPMGLKHSFFDAGDVITERFAVGHHAVEEGPVVARPWPLPRASYPAGGVATDIKDLLRYAAAHMQSREEAHSDDGFSAQAIHLMHTPQRRIRGSQEWIGLPWFITEVEGGQLHWHQGATNGQVSCLYTVPEEGFAVAVLTNSSSGAALTRSITALALKHYVNIPRMIPSATPVDLPDLSAFPGIYERPFARLKIVQSVKNLLAHFSYLGGFPSKDDPPPPDPPEMCLAPWAEDCFIVVDGPSKDTFVDFIRDETGAIQFVRAFNRVHPKKG